MYATDRQTDVRRKHCLMPPPYGSGDIISGVGTGGSGGSMNWDPRVVGPQKNFRQENNRPTSKKN